MNIFLYCPDENIFQELMRIGLSPKIWICDGKKNEEKIGDVLVYGHRILKHGNIKPVFCSVPKDVYDNVFRKSYDFFERAIERAIRKESDRTRSWADKRHQFDIMIKWYYYILTSKKIDIIFFSNIPHEGTNIILYFLAKEMGVKTILAYQTLFPNLFFLVEDFEDIGIYKTSMKSSKVRGCINIDDNSPPFYMKVIDSPFIIRKKLFLARIQAAINIIRNPIRKIFGKNPKFRYRRILNYKNRIKMLDIHKNISSDIDFKVPYVYFPLHLQPEMTVDILGHEFADQLSAIEALRQILPEEVCIYVKENPKQTIYAREEHFFKRLRSIPNTFYLNINVSTYDLIRNSRVVATIVGTAGWEALKMGKPVITFGHAWYRNFPGVFDWGKGVQWSDILNYKFDKRKLEESVKDFSKYLCEGCVDEDYSVLIENFDETENAKKVVEAFLRYIEYLGDGKLRRHRDSVISTEKDA